MHPDVVRKCMSVAQIGPPTNCSSMKVSCINFSERNNPFSSERQIFCCVLIPVSRFDFCRLLCPTALHVTAKTMRLRMRKASQQPNPSLASRPSRTKRRHSEVEEDTPTSGGRGLFSTIKKFIRGNAVKVMTFL